MTSIELRGARACRREADGSAIYRVGENTPPTRLDLFLKERIPKLSRRRIQQAVRDRVELRGPGGLRPATPATLVRSGDVVVIRRVEPQAEEAPGIALPLIYLDEELIVVDKPAGLLSHPSNRVQKHCVTWILARQVEGPIHLIHRLDRETSGILLAARTTSAARVLSRQIARTVPGVEKRYLAIVFGEMALESGTIDLPIGRAVRSAVYIKRGVNLADGLRSETSYRVLSKGGGFSFVDIRLGTGRRHQIRVHLAAIGHPVVGDKLYGSAESHYLRFIRSGFDERMRGELMAERQMLHAARVDVLHPGTAARCRFDSPLPEDMRLFVSRIG